MPPTSSSTPSKAAVLAVPGTLFPHVLLDEVMPTLSGSEWVLLCVIVRQTLGWHDPETGGRKASDWLSHRQLKARTGRGSDAVCAAIDSLVRHDLIEVKDEAGRLLPTPAERRRASRLFYALSPSLLSRLNTSEHPEPELSEKPKPHPLTNRENQPKSPPTIRSFRFRKSETTKETETKYTQRAFGKTEWEQATQGHTPFKVVRSEDEGCGCFRTLTPPPLLDPASTPAPPEPCSPELASFLDFYHERFRHHRGGQDDPDALDSEDRARLQAALDRHGLKRLEQLVEMFLGSDSPLLHHEGYRLEAFVGVIPTLAVLRAKPSMPAPGQVLEAEPKATTNTSPGRDREEENEGKDSLLIRFNNCSKPSDRGDKPHLLSK